ncbi:hypothetical protein EDB84DRAFT_1443392 [Lactarius hengduanensis]|nr:hypothetical protein EDB84DRAFT_1443392 [Lactarius hengduanensis]
MSQIPIPTPTGIIQGPRKRRPTERVTENGDPLAKKAKRTPRTSVNARAVHVTPQTSVEDVPNPTRRPQHLPPRRHQSSGAADSSDEEADTTGSRMQSMVDPIEVSSGDERSDDSDEPEVEDDISELSKLGVHLFSLIQYA